MNVMPQAGNIDQRNTTARFRHWPGFLMSDGRESAPDDSSSYPPPRLRTVTIAIVTHAAAATVITMPTRAMSRMEK